MAVRRRKQANVYFMAAMKAKLEKREGMKAEKTPNLRVKNHGEKILYEKKLQIVVYNKFFFLSQP